MVKHLVMWNIQEGNDKKEVLNKLKETLESLVDKIEELKKIEVGFNYKDTPTSHEVVLYSEFNTKEDLESYLVHPAHVEAGKYIRSVVKDRVCVDYEI